MKFKNLLFYIYLIPFQVFAQSQRQVIVTIPFEDVLIPNIVQISGIKQLETGFYHVGFITDNNEVKFFQDQRAPSLDLPVVYGEVKAIASGEVHSILLFSDGTIYQYLLADSMDAFFPWNLKDIKEISTGNKLSSALNKRNILFTWGPYGLVDSLKIHARTYGVKTSSVGENHVAFINIKDRIFVWGDHTKGQGTIPRPKSKPYKIVSGNNHILSLHKNGTYQVWGDNKHKQCNGPVISDTVVDIFAKANNSAILTSSNKLYIWGEKYNDTLDLSKYGKVNKISLGDNFLTMSMDYEPEELQSLQNKLLTHYQLSTISPQSDKEISSEFSGKVLRNFKSDNSDENVMRFINRNAKVHGSNNNTEYQFEGKGNTITVLNENTEQFFNNNSGKVIFKGSNNNITFKQTGRARISNQTGTTVIDLDKLAAQQQVIPDYDEAVEYKYNPSNKIQRNDPKLNNTDNNIRLESFSRKKSKRSHDTDNVIDNENIDYTDYDEVIEDSHENVDIMEGEWHNEKSNNFTSRKKQSYLDIYEDSYNEELENKPIVDTTDTNEEEFENTKTDFQQAMDNLTPTNIMYNNYIKAIIVNNDSIYDSYDLVDLFDSIPTSEYSFELAQKIIGIKGEGFRHGVFVLEYCALNNKDSYCAQALAELFFYGYRAAEIDDAKAEEYYLLYKSLK